MHVDKGVDAQRQGLANLIEVWTVLTAIANMYIDQIAGLGDREGLIQALRQAAFDVPGTAWLEAYADAIQASHDIFGQIHAAHGAGQRLG